MPSTIQYNLTGGAANANPNLSLGGASSSVVLSTTAMNALFDNVDTAEALAGDVEYRCIDIKNAGNEASALTAFYMRVDTSSISTELDFGMVAAPLNSVESVANESTAPTGVVFAHYTAASKLSLPNIAAGSYCRVWIRRTVNALAVNTTNDLGSFATDYA